MTNDDFLNLPIYDLKNREQLVEPGKVFNALDDFKAFLNKSGTAKSIELTGGKHQAPTHHRRTLIRNMYHLVEISDTEDRAGLKNIIEGYLFTSTGDFNLISLYARIHFNKYGELPTTVISDRALIEKLDFVSNDRVDFYNFIYNDKVQDVINLYLDNKMLSFLIKALNDKNKTQIENPERTDDFYSTIYKLIESTIIQHDVFNNMYIELLDFYLADIPLHLPPILSKFLETINTYKLNELYPAQAQIFYHLVTPLITEVYTEYPDTCVNRLSELEKLCVSSANQQVSNSILPLLDFYDTPTFSTFKEIEMAIFKSEVVEPNIALPTY